MEIKIKIRPFEVPTHVFAEARYSGLKQDGMVANNPKWILAELDEEALSALCDQFRKDVFAQAGKKDEKKVVYRSERVVTSKSI